MSDFAIKVENVSKAYTIWRDPAARLKHPFLDLAGELFPALRPRIDQKMQGLCTEFYALKYVSFEVRKGESVGIIGRNGSGKSTLLQIIAGTLQPTEGSVTVNGRVAALLELGSGFNPEFTGRENVYLNASILGFKKNEIDDSFESIHQFSGIGEFIEQPVKTYSSGMMARLAFAVSVQLRPDILIVDEALSVGDMAFQEKSITKMKEIRNQGTTILFVSHAPSAVRNFCDNGIWLDQGKIKRIDNSHNVSTDYENEIIKEIVEKKKISTRDSSVSEENSEIKIKIKKAILDKNEYKTNESININIHLDFAKENIKFGVGIIIKDIKGNIISIINTLRDDIIISEKKDNITLSINKNKICSGVYYVTVIISDELGMCAFDKKEDCCSFTIAGERSRNGLLKNEGIVQLDHIWMIN
jgi:ABC-type polysaccharide/polyol phosphate transport system ATPase subunit